ncbi:hypothetical protein B0H13DRAFT_2521887 [Mycena leptocephala]|nr:hypothetical protein B0H13DRAFT_2521887 [Mycena leptocephala]
MTAPSYFTCGECPQLCRLSFASVLPPFQPWNSGRDNLRAVSQAGYDITKRLGVTLYPPVFRMLNRSSVDVEFIPQGHRYDVFENSDTSNSSRIHARFDYLTAHLPLALALAPAFVDLSHRLALPHHPSRRGAVRILFIRIDHTCPRAPLWLAPCLIPACGRADDAQLSVLCTFAFRALRVLCVRAGAAFFGAGAVRWVHTMLPPLPSLFASAAMHLLRNECNGYGRYLSARVHLVRLAHLMYLVRRSTEVDGDGITMQGRFVGDGVQVRVRIHPSPALTLGRFRLWSALPLAFALVLVPVPVCSLVPPASPSPHCVVRNAQASSCAGPRTYPRTRRDGEARVPVRAHPPSLSSRIALLVRTVFPSAYGYARAVELERGVNSGVHVCAYGAHHALVLGIERSRKAVPAYTHRRRCFLRGYRGRTPRIWVYF